MRVQILIPIVTVSLLCSTFGKKRDTAEGRDWPAYGGHLEGTRYSPLKQITRANVSRLKVAWTYDTADGPGDPQTQPIVVDGVLFGVTPGIRW